jgi:lambda family phage portal protein
VGNQWFERPLGQTLMQQLRDKADAQQAQQQAAGAKTQQPRASGRRMYAAARFSRLTADWQASDTSADGELVTSLRNLRGRSRQLCRDASYAKRAKTLVVNNVVGWCGIGMQAQVKTNGGDLIKRINDEIEEVWEEWCQADQCHIGGRLHFSHMERACVAEVFEAGEVFVRIHRRSVGRSRIPLTLELIEAERLADDFSRPGPAESGNHVRMGVEVDKYYRPVAYWIRERHPGEIRWQDSLSSVRYERVPAADIIHLAIIDRWPQTRGEPWLHAAARRLNDMDGYAEAEMVRARSQANNAGWIETPEDAESFGEVQEDGSVEMEAEPGVWKRLSPGEKASMPAPSAPNSAFPDFMRMMLREVSAGAGPSYEAISRDYSQSNYSSSRMGILDDRDGYRFFQWWLIRDLRKRLHPIFLMQGSLAGVFQTFTLEQYANNMRKFEATRWKPRGWTWIDPTSEVEAYLKAIEGGVTTLTDVIAATAGGQDIEDMINTRVQELEMLRQADLKFTTSPEVYAPSEAAPAQPADGSQPQSTDSGMAGVRERADAYGVAVRAGAVTPQVSDEEAFRAAMGLPAMSPEARAAWDKDKGTRRPITITPPPGEQGAAPPSEAAEDEDTNPPPRRVFSLQR